MCTTNMLIKIDIVVVLFNVVSHANWHLNEYDSGESMIEILSSQTCIPVKF